MTRVSTKLYIATLVATFIVFSAALIISNYITNKKTQELQASEDKIALDILSLETQFELITSSSCAAFDDAALRSELESLSVRLAFLERQVGQEDPQVFRLKRYYSLLEIKHYLLIKRMIKECKRSDIPILYFYATQNCPVCTTQEYMLRAIQQEYPQVEVYSFDYNLDLPAVQTLISLHNIPKEPPVLDINGKLYAAFPTYEDFKVIIDSLATTTSKATTTKSSIQPSPR